jgi:hypothetical protein
MFFLAHVFLSLESNKQLSRIKSLDSIAYTSLSNLWVEGTYRSVGLGASEGLQSTGGTLSGTKPLHVKNPITDFVLRNNLSIACLQMDGLWTFQGHDDIFVLEGNITFKGDYPFNKGLNNNVLYTKSYYLREGDNFELMSTSINKDKSRSEYKNCSDTKISVTRNIRFDNYLEQMNSLTYPSGYLPVELPSMVGFRENTQTSYITNQEYLARMKGMTPKYSEPVKTAKNANGLFMSFLSIPGLLNANKALDMQSKAIDVDHAAANVAMDDYTFALDLRVKYLTRMAGALNCDTSRMYEDICSLGGEITYQ